MTTQIMATTPRLRNKARHEARNIPELSTALFSVWPSGTPLTVASVQDYCDHLTGFPYTLIVTDQRELKTSTTWQDSERVGLAVDDNGQVREALGKIVKKMKSVLTPDLSSVYALYDTSGASEQEQIKRFLIEKGLPLNHLQQAYNNVIATFGSHHRPKLSISNDMDGDGADETLLVVIPTHLSVQEALLKLDQVSESWWLNLPEPERHYLYPHVEFI